MDVEEASFLNNALAVQASYSTSASQRWHLVYAGDY